MSNLEQENFDIQFEDYLKRNPHFVSPGAKIYYHRVLFGYVILAVACIVGIWSLSNSQDSHLRKDINTLGAQSCISSIATYNKFNDLLDTQIKAQVRAKRINAMNGLNNRVTLNNSIIAELQKDKIVPPTVEQCKAKKLIRG